MTTSLRASGRHYLWALVGFAFVVCHATTALAAPLNYQESVSGDLSAGPTNVVGDTLTVFTLDVGSNTVTGTLGITSTNPYRADLDSFAFVVPVGMVLASGSLSATDAAGNAGDFTSVGWGLFAGLYPSSTYLGSINAGVPGTAAIDTQGAGTYSLEFQSGNWNGFGVPALVNYTFTLNLRQADPPTPSVPEPTSMLLLSTGLAGVIAARRRRQ